MFTVLMIIFILDVILLVPVILMQSGSGAQSGVFGSDLTLGAFGAKTSEVLVRFTKWLVGIFLASAFLMGYIKIKEVQSYARQHPQQTQESGTPAVQTNANPAKTTATNAGTNACIKIPPLSNK